MPRGHPPHFFGSGGVSRDRHGDPVSAFNADLSSPDRGFSDPKAQRPSKMVMRFSGDILPLRFASLFRELALFIFYPTQPGDNRHSDRIRADDRGGCDPDPSGRGIDPDMQVLDRLANQFD